MPVKGLSPDSQESRYFVPAKGLSPDISHINKR